MAKKVVVMPLIPGILRRGTRIRTDLGYTKYGEATWRWWCAQHGIEFVVVKQPLGGSEYSHMPPTIQRWFAPKLLIREHGDDTRVAVVDADTMIRWDAPDFLEAGEGFVAVRGVDPTWIGASIDAFQPLFPGISLPLREYFNAGVVVVGKAQLHVFCTFLQFASNDWSKLNAVILSGNFGTDQTPLNFLLRRENERVHFLPRSFNLLHCFPMDPLLGTIDQSPVPDRQLFAEKAFSRPHAFEFVERGYIWHFTNVRTLRSMVMREAWKRVSINYPGVDILDDE